MTQLFLLRQRKYILQKLTIGICIDQGLDILQQMVICIEDTGNEHNLYKRTLRIIITFSFTSEN